MWTVIQFLLLLLLSSSVFGICNWEPEKIYFILTLGGTVTVFKTQNIYFAREILGTI